MCVSVFITRISFLKLTKYFFSDRYIVLAEKYKMVRELTQAVSFRQHTMWMQVFFVNIVNDNVFDDRSIHKWKSFFDDLPTRKYYIRQKR